MAEPYADPRWRQKRDTAMDRVNRASSVEDRLAVKWAIVWCCQERENFTGDDVMYRLEDLEITLREPRLLGSMMNLAAKKNIIRPVSCPTCLSQQNRPSARRHGSPQKVWKRGSDIGNR